MANFSFTYIKDGSPIELKDAIHIGDVLQMYDPGESEEVGFVALHVYMRNTGRYDAYSPGLYVERQDFDAAKPRYKTFRTILSTTTERNPFLAVLFNMTLDGTDIDWTNAVEFNDYQGTKNAPILFTSTTPGIIIKNGLNCLPINGECDFWLRLQNNQTTLPKDIEKGLAGFSLKVYKEIYG